MESLEQGRLVYLEQGRLVYLEQFEVQYNPCGLLVTFAYLHDNPFNPLLSRI